MSRQEQEAVLSRWSRRKLQTEEESKREDTILEAAEATDDQANLQALEVDEAPPVLTDDDMPPIESLHEDSDFSMFMSSGVSDKLRNMALRKMFHAPVFNIRDGLDEYDDDFTSFEPLGDIVTSDMKHQIEMLEKKQLEEAELKPDGELVDAEQEPVEDVDAESNPVDEIVEEPEQSEMAVEKHESV